MRMEKWMSLLISLVIFALVVVGCAPAGVPEKTTERVSQSTAQPTESVKDTEAEVSTETEAASSAEKVELTMWFWGSTSEQQAALSKNLVDKFNANNPGYNLTVEYRSSVNKDMAVALSADDGPDIIYESSPSLALTYIEAGKYANLDKYAEQYGWADRLLGVLYDSGVYQGSLYSLPMGMNVIGMVYNRDVLEENGWDVPTTEAELIEIMDSAIEKGMYGSVTGNKGWQPTNEDYSSLFLNSFAGAEKVYKALVDEVPWTDEDLVAAIQTSADWYKKGYLGTDYFALDWADSAMLLAEGRAPFYFGPLKFIQNLMGYAVDDQVNSFGFTAFPAVGDHPATFTVGATGLLAINENTEHKDVCAEFLDMMMTNEFVEAMANDWPGYWAVPLTTLNEVDATKFDGLPKMFVEGVMEASKAINEGNFGYYNSSYMPAEAFDLMVVIDSVWLDEKTAEDFMEEIDASFQKDFDAGKTPIVPAFK